MKLRFHISKLREHLSPDYLADLIGAGSVDGNVLRIEAGALLAVKSRHELVRRRIAPPIQIAHRPMRGLGDLVAFVAKPVGQGIDRVFGTNLTDCLGCGRRQNKWNEAIPFRSVVVQETDLNNEQI